MRIKQGVRVFGIRPELVLALVVVDRRFEQHGLELVLTSGVEGEHKRASLHYTGNAGDLRRPSLQSLAEQLVAECKEALGDDFDVVLEGDHIHVEFQPKRPY